MSEEETVTFNLELNVEQCIDNIRQIEALLYRTMGLLHRLNLPDDIEQGIARLQRLIMTIRLTHTALIALEAASGPLGWALAGVGIVSAAWTAYDVAYEMSGK